MTVIIVVAQLITSLLAAYAFTFLDFPLKRTMFVVFMATLMLPIEVTLIPNVQTVRQLGWLNYDPGLTAPFLATALRHLPDPPGLHGHPPRPARRRPPRRLRPPRGSCAGSPSR